MRGPRRNLESSGPMSRVVDSHVVEVVRHRIEEEDQRPMPQAVLVAAPFARRLAALPKARSPPHAPTILLRRLLLVRFSASPRWTNQPSTTSSSAALSRKASRAGTSPAWLLCAPAFPSKFTPGVTVNRLCASRSRRGHLKLADHRIRSGAASVIIAGGAKRRSLPANGRQQAQPQVNPPGSPRTIPRRFSPWASQLSASHDTILFPAKIKVTFALARATKELSPRKRRADLPKSWFPSKSRPQRWPTFPPRKAAHVLREKEFSADEGPRADTSAAALAALKPAFHAQGSVTAGNSSQTSDGAAAVVLMEAGRARELGIQPLARSRVPTP